MAKEFRGYAFWGCDYSKFRRYASPPVPGVVVGAAAVVVVSSSVVVVVTTTAAGVVVPACSHMQTGSPFKTVCL